MSDLRRIAERALSRNYTRARVSTVIGAGEYGVTLPGQTAEVRCRSLSGSPHEVDDEVVMLRIPSSTNRGKGLPLWLILDSIGQAGSAETVNLVLTWPAWRHDTRRSAAQILSAAAPGFADPPVALQAFGGSARYARATVEYFLTTDNGFRVYSLADGSHLNWGGGGTPSQLNEATWIFWDNDSGRLYLARVDGFGDTWIHSYSIGSNQLLTQGFQGATSVGLEGWLHGGSMWIVAGTNHITDWTLKGLDPDNLGSVLHSWAATWPEWSQAQELPHSISPNAYPIIPLTYPFFGWEASNTPAIQPIVLPSGLVVLSGDTAPFIARLQDERSNIRTYHDSDPRNYALVQSRSCIQARDTSDGSTAWTVQGWPVSAAAPQVWRGFTPVLGVGSNVLAHVARAEFATVQFRHGIATVGIQDYIAGLPRAPGEFDPTQYGFHEPYWPNFVTVPEEVWQSGYVDGLIPGVLANLKPGVTGIITRDIQSSLSHGLTLRSGTTGAEVATVTWDDADEHSPTRVEYDTGDPATSPHAAADEFGYTPPPRWMLAGDYTSQTVTIAGVAGSLETAMELPPNQFVVSYVARETYTGDSWLGDDGLQHSTFYRAHAWYGGSVDADGVSHFSAAPLIWRQHKDPEGRWSHYTASVTYHCWIAERLVPTVEVADTQYGWDPHNPVAGDERIFFPPRFVPQWQEPDRLWAFWPPNSRLLPDGSFSVNFFYQWWEFGWGGGGTVPWVNWIAPHAAPALPDGYSDGIGHASTTVWEEYFSQNYTFFGVTATYRDPDKTLYPFGTQVQIPRFGFWPDGSQVRYLSPPAFGAAIVGANGLPDYSGYGQGPPPGFEWRGGAARVHGDSGIYLWGRSPGDEAPHRAESTRMHGVLRAVSASTLETLWDVDFGVIAHKAAPQACYSGGKLWLWMAGTVYRINPTSGSVEATMAIPGSETWTHAEIIATNGKLWLTGSGGKFMIA